MSRSPANFGNLPRDGSSTVIQAGNAIQTKDATASPNNSPLSYTTGTTTLAVPSNALELALLATTALRVSESSSVATYFVIPANTLVAIGCANMANVYVAADASSGTLQFYFITV